MSEESADIKTQKRAAPRRPSECTNMADVRREIDQLDRAVVDLLTTRQAYVEAAARIKQDRSLVRDDERIQHVLEHVIEQARHTGLDTHLAETVWRALIEASIRHELAAFDRKHDNH